MKWTRATHPWATTATITTAGDSRSVTVDYRVYEEEVDTGGARTTAYSRRVEVPTSSLPSDFTVGDTVTVATADGAVNYRAKRVWRSNHPTVGGFTTIELTEAT